MKEENMRERRFVTGNGQRTSLKGTFRFSYMRERGGHRNRKAKNHVNKAKGSILDRMLLFCPTCSNVLTVEEGTGPSCYRFACQTCPYVYNITKKISSKKYPKLKEVDDVLGGKEAWENVDSTEERCPKCEHDRAYFMQIQTRSADEPMTTFYKCCKCGHRWRE